MTGNARLIVPEMYPAGLQHRDVDDVHHRQLGVNIRLLYTLVFGLGAVLAGIAGLMAGPLLAVEPGMGEDMLILAFVVLVIGGIGSIRGALIASILIGIVETVGRSILPFMLEAVLSNEAAQTAGPALAWEKVNVAADVGPRGAQRPH